MLKIVNEQSPRNEPKHSVNQREIYHTLKQVQKTPPMSKAHSKLLPDMLLHKRKLKTRIKMNIQTRYRSTSTSRVADVHVDFFLQHHYKKQQQIIFIYLHNARVAF